METAGRHGYNFGPASINDLFSPCNGLFLEKDIEKALDRGLIAIVPHVNLDPRIPTRHRATKLNDLNVFKLGKF